MNYQVLRRLASITLILPVTFADYIYNRVDCLGGWRRGYALKNPGKIRLTEYSYYFVPNPEKLREFSPDEIMKDIGG